MSGITIFTTIQTQDFPDAEGDSAIGRVTFPIYAPRFARWFTGLVVPAWSAFHCWLWDVGVMSSSCTVLFGLFVGGRFVYPREQQDDRKSYLIFNVSDPSSLTF